MFNTIIQGFIGAWKTFGGVPCVALIMAFGFAGFYMTFMQVILLNVVLLCGITSLK